jgi:hypothetical protein
MVALGFHLKQRGFAIWDLGERASDATVLSGLVDWSVQSAVLAAHPKHIFFRQGMCLPYKFDLGAEIMERQEFSKLVIAVGGWVDRVALS